MVITESIKCLVFFFFKLNKNNNKNNDMTNATR